MSKKLLAHFRAMQDRAADYIEPSGGYTDIEGRIHRNALSSQAEEVAFMGDTIYMLDGPEQREAQADAEFDFIELSARTASDKFHGEFVSFDGFRKKLSNFIQAAEELDRYKKLMFYGEDPAKGRFRDDIGEGHANAVRLVDNVVGFDEDGPWIGEDDAANLIHGVIGSCTEAGEMAEALFKCAILREPGDRANFLEEVFDDQWYHAMICRVFHKDFDTGQRMLIEKLRVRFPDKFTSDKANNRDLSSERAVLESGAAVETTGFAEVVEDETPINAYTTRGDVARAFPGAGRAEHLGGVPLHVGTDNADKKG